MDLTPEKPSREELAVLQASVEHGTLDDAAAALLVPLHEAHRLLEELHRRAGVHYLPQLIAWALHYGWREPRGLRATRVPASRPAI